MKCEWDNDKAASNWAKHGITFNEAETVLDDAQTAYAPDPLHSDDEERGIAIGYSIENRLLIVIYTNFVEEPRIISARKATKWERRNHEQNREYYI